MKKFLAFFGHINIDVKIRVGDVNLPGSQKAETVEELFGGTAGNFAMIAARLNFPFDLYSSVSSSTHRRYIDHLSNMGVDVSKIDIREGFSGPVCYIITDGERQRAFMHQGPIENWKASEGFNGDNYLWINLGTGPADEYMKIAERSRLDSVVFDPGQELSYRYDDGSSNFMVKNSSMFIVNSDEFSILKERLSRSGLTPEAVSKRFIVTRGSAGVELYNKGETIKFRSMKTPAVYDTVGAGDAFRAGLYFGIYKKYDLADAVVLGIITASEAIKKPVMEFSMTPEQLTESFERNRDSLLS